MTTFTLEEIQALYAPFALEAHRCREGGKVGGMIQWFFYLDRLTIQKRLEVLFPLEWSFNFIHEHTENAAEVTTVYTRLSIRDVSRDFNGTGTPHRRKDSEEDGIDENSPKSAMTDAFRRTASMFGLGAYLYDTPMITTAPYDWKIREEKKKREDEAMSQFAAWYNRAFGGGSSTPATTTKPAATTPAKRTNPYQATQQTPANGGQVSNQPGWEMNNQTEGVLIMQVKNAVAAHPAEVANTVKKMRNEGAFDDCPTFADAVALAIERVNSHKEAA